MPVKSTWLLFLLVPACATSGNAWLREQSVQADAEPWVEHQTPPRQTETRKRTQGLPVTSRTLGAADATASEEAEIETANATRTQINETGTPRPPRRNNPKPALEGKVLGTFRNTYYDFPYESDFGGETVALHDAQCKPLAQVPRSFFEALCVQGSGLLASGTTVSFNRRDCECAEVCPKTQQRICFDALSLAKFPWGRGATGSAITPLLTVAVDSKVIALGTPLYIPEFDGLPRDPAHNSRHDGCFIAQDRGLKVQGQHVDVFTGQRSITQLWNGLVPSNAGVTVVVDNPKCARAD